MAFEKYSNKSVRGTKPKATIYPDSGKLRLNKAASDKFEVGQYALFKFNFETGELAIQKAKSDDPDSYSVTSDKTNVVLSAMGVLKNGFGINPTEWEERKIFDVDVQGNRAVVDLSDVY